MSSTPDFEAFNPKVFAASVRAFLKENNITLRQWVKMSGSSFDNLRRLEKGKDVLVSTVARHQKIMRTYRPAALPSKKRLAQKSS